ncbi:MAG: trigger factor [Bacteroidetes bacterium]|nr:trigger factor [Bacteroidota bacterium]
MIVTRHDVDSLNAKLKVEVAPADYQEKVKKSLEKYRKTAKIPGFRPGHVPMGIIQKQYGNSVLADAINHLVNDALSNYITESKIEILGRPLPSEKEGMKGSFETPDSFEFTFEIGLSPKFEVPLTEKSKYDYIKIKIDSKLVDEQIEDLRRRYGKMMSEANVADRDLVLGQFVELNEDASIKEGGVMHTSTVSVEFIEDSSTKKSLLGKAVGDQVILDPLKVSRGGKDTAAMLGLKEDQMETISNKFQFTINEIKRMELAELNQELFDKLYGEGEVNSEAEMRQRISKDLDGMFNNDSDRLLTKNVYDDLLEKTKMDLPNEFLKRFIRENAEKPITAEEVEQQYDSFKKGMKWQLIQGQIIKKNNIQIEYKDLVEFTKSLLVSNYAQYGIPAPEDKELTESALTVLKNREESDRVYEMMLEQRMNQYIKSTVKLKEKEVSYDEFVKLANQN